MSSETPRPTPDAEAVYTEAVDDEAADDGRPRSGGLTVGRAAALLGVSVKTLHHWDAVGLVRPGERTGGGYRVYAHEDITRLFRVLVYRELGFPLAEIGRLLDDPDTEPREHLRRQRAQLAERLTQLQSTLDTVDRMLETSDAGLRLTPEQQVEIFGADWQPSRVEEAAERWGGTAQWAQYAERAAQRTPEEWREVAATTEALHTELVAAKRSGLPPGSEEARGLAERHRLLMSGYFDCTHAMQVCLGRMFVEDPRFADYYDGLAPGLARWLRDAIDANARAHGVSPHTARWE
ncbi:MerR family transcriptional regulator [Streptomyces sp. AJS327]|uniref:MerR family transcriptional regulator n=1 Tax=Streptomyces sp. AJS327 TaxID=2545265 RepID=UPI0015DF9B14|nr:MerR family transcriptional regulator [Streptomyces sp. AJS327]MBA0052847.1 MerR family transcriptional regulator [Streptomyces sp. AJS327]